MNAKIFLATGPQGITRAERGLSGTWSVENTLIGRDVRCLGSDPLDPDVIYAGTQGDGVFRSVDRGRTWEQRGLAGQIVKAIAVSGLERDTVFAGTKPALIFVSRDGGGHWGELSSFRKIPSRRLWFSPAESPFTAYVQGIALSPVRPDIILVGIEFGAVVRSADGGRSWTNHRRRALRDCHTITFHATNGDWAYEAGGSGGGAAVSRDGGESWIQPRTGLDRHYGWACAADPELPELWYVSVSPSPSKAHHPGRAQARIFRATVEGGWEKLSGGLPDPLNDMPYALVTDPRTSGHVYAGLSNGDVWHSGDRGDTWRLLPVRLGGIHRALLVRWEV